MMGELERHADFKGRYDYSLQAYNDAGNAKMQDVDICLDYLSKLNDQHGQFRADMLNTKTNNPASFPKNLAELYGRQGAYEQPSSAADVGPAYKAAFVAEWRGGRRRGGRSGGCGGRDNGGRGDGGRGDSGKDKDGKKRNRAICACSVYGIALSLQYLGQAQGCVRVCLEGQTEVQQS